MSQEKAALKAGMARKTARKYVAARMLPSERERPPRAYRTRPDDFESVWPEVAAQLEVNPRLQTKTLFEWLQREHPGRFADGQLRTLQRRVKGWRATEGPPKEVYFAQVHEPGKLCASDFTCMNALAVTIQGVPLRHLLYHFVLTYSNWEHVTLCYSESFEALSMGLQNALWALGGVPTMHRTDQLTAAVNQIGGPNPRDMFQQRYLDVLDHYGVAGQKTQADHPNENGDVEQSHHRLKERLDQALMLRGGRDFESVEGYLAFVRGIIDRLNAGRRVRLAEEIAVMRPLPARRIDSVRRVKARVDRGSLIRVDKNVYSVNSRLIGESVTVAVRLDELEVWYGQKLVDRLPRLRGSGKHLINYRHVIDWLVRKPGAFASYRYHEDLFPTSRFRMAYDALNKHGAGAARYLKILELAARSSESAVDDALRDLLDRGAVIDPEAVERFVDSELEPRGATEVEVVVPGLSIYDALLGRDPQEEVAA
jgi:transposase